MTDFSNVFDTIVLPDDLEGWKHFMADELRADGDIFDFRISHKSGEMRWLSLVKRDVSGTNGSSLGLRCSLRDITERKKMELQLRHQALHDPLTSMANRNLLMDRVGRAVERFKRHPNYHFSLVFLDLDRFKVVNDSLGHLFGDRLLMDVGRRLMECVRGMDTVARFGGDEFVILLEELVSPREAFTVVRRVLDALRNPFDIEGHQVQTTASLGVMLDAQASDTSHDLLQKANIAMYRAKESGRNRFHVYNENMLKRAVDLMNLENDLRNAVSNKDTTVAYQPIVSLGDGKLVGFEVLARWTHEERGVVSPAEFIPIAEETGLIIELGRDILEEACRTLAKWQRKHKAARDLYLSVNISARQFRNNDLIQDVTEALRKARLDPRCLQLEITETTVMDDVKISSARLDKLREQGVSLSMDDFGTGYSSMSYLQRFQLDQLKIDLSFVRRILEAPENAEIVRAIINLAHSLRMRVVAEGIEMPDQETLLYSLQCDLGQGYYYSKPAPRDEAEEFMRQAFEA